MTIQWLGLCALTAEVEGSITGEVTKMLQAMWCGPKKKKRRKKEMSIYPPLKKRHDKEIKHAVFSSLVHIMERCVNGVLNSDVLNACECAQSVIQ